MPRRGGFKRRKATGEWIRDHLREVETDYVGSMCKKFRKWCKKWVYKPPTPGSFRRTVWLLKELGLLKLDHVSDGPNPRWKRHYYVISGPENHPGWRRPVEVRYGKKIK